MTLVEAQGEALLAAVEAMLARAGIVAPAEIEARIALTDRASPAQGARMVARAWTDPDYATDPSAARWINANYGRQP